jgi:tetratricopeptide (TPR) repeat protein
MLRATVTSLLAVIAFAIVADPAAAWDRQAQFLAREAQLKQAIAQRPNDPAAHVALAAFYLRPVVPRDVEAADGKVRRVMVPVRNEWSGPIKDIYAVPWVFRGNPNLALPHLKKALELTPNYPGAMRWMALQYRMRSDLDRMRPYMEAALKLDPYDLDMCRLYLDHRTALARTLEDLAAQDLQVHVRHEDRSDGRYRITEYPSESEKARAAQYQRQAQDARRDAIRPLKNLAGALKNDPRTRTTPALASKWRLTTAIYFAWIGELEKSAGTAVAALREDPTNLDALDYIVDTLRLTHTNDHLAKYKAILDRWNGADSTPMIIRDNTVRPKG